MTSDKIRWCLKKKVGLKVISPNLHISESYMQEANDTFDSMLNTKGKWKVIMAYYSSYNALYSILMKCGISSENHECTIEMMKMLGFSEKNCNYMKELKHKRIDVQYYLKKIELGETIGVKLILNECKKILVSLSDKQIANIREELCKK